MYKYLLVLISVCFAMTGCVKDQNEFIKNTEERFYSSGILGIVQDEEGQPIEGASVEYEGLFTLTDVNGVYQFNNVEVSSELNIVIIQKSGFQSASRVFSTDRSASLQLKNTLLRNEFNLSFLASTGGSISENNITIEFPANAIVERSSGNPYSGQVFVSIKNIDVTTPGFFNRMPGSTDALNDAGAIAVLATYGIAAVVMEGPLGLPLKLANDQQARIEMKIPSPLLSECPSELSVWGMDHKLKLWKKKGIAKLVNDTYQGSLSDLDYCNFGFPFNSVKLQGRIIDKSGKNLGHMSLSLNTDLDNFKTTCITDDQGQFTVMVPQDRAIDLHVLSTSDCQFPDLEPSRLGPFTDHSEVNQITVDINTGTYTRVEAQLISCNGQPVQNGYLAVMYKGSFLTFLPAGVDGSVVGNIVTCDNNAQISFTAINNESSEKSDAQTFDPSSLIQMGTVIVCKEESDFIRVKIPDLNYDTTAYTNVLFENNKMKTLEASLPINPPFFGISWEESDSTKVTPGVYDILLNQAYVALAKEMGYDFYKVRMGKVTITQGANLEGKAIRGSFQMEMRESVKQNMIQVLGTFKATFK